MGRTTERWEPPAETLAHFPEISGNTVNGLGEGERRRPSPFFWHEPKYQTHGELQAYVVSQFYDPPEIAEAFSRDPVTLALRPRGPDPVPVADERIERSPAEWTQVVKEFALANEADLVGIARMDPLWIYEGFEIAEQWLIVLGFAHDYDEISKAPAVPGRLNAGLEVGRQYTRAARSANTLRNFIREQGWPSESFPGPRADALLMIPAAIAAGLGELGKHGSIINRTHGASFRLAAVSTDMRCSRTSPTSSARTTSAGAAGSARTPVRRRRSASRSSSSAATRSGTSTSIAASPTSPRRRAARSASPAAPGAGPGSPTTCS